MLIIDLINIIGAVITAIMTAINAVLAVIFPTLQFVPVIHLPDIGGYGIDSALLTGIQQFNSIKQTVWLLSDLQQAFLFVLYYFIAKFVIKTFLGSRAPGN